MTKLSVLVSGDTGQQVGQLGGGPRGRLVHFDRGFPSFSWQARQVSPPHSLAWDQPFRKWVKLFPKLRIRQVPFFRLGFWRRGGR